MSQKSSTVYLKIQTTSLKQKQKISMTTEKYSRKNQEKNGEKSCQISLSETTAGK